GHPRKERQTEATCVISLRLWEIAGPVSETLAVPGLEVDREIVDLGTNPRGGQPFEHGAPPLRSTANLRHQQVVRGFPARNFCQEADVFLPVGQEVCVPLHEVPPARHKLRELAHLRKTKSTLEIGNAIIKPQF